MYQKLRAMIMRIYLVGGALLLLLFTPSTAFADTTTASSDTTPTSTSSTPTTDNSSPAPTSSTSAPTTNSSPTPPSATSTASTQATTTSSPSTPSTSQSAPQNTSSTSSTTPKLSTKQGPTSPPGPASNTYTYDPSTGLWTNGYYAWDPSTGQTTPLTPQTYSYNPATGHWDTTQYVYDAPSGKYVPNVVSVTTPPAGATVTNSPTNPKGPSSIPTSTTSGDSLFNNFYNASISNQINGTATSGDSLVIGNTTGGNSASGNAADLANVINMIQSSAGFSSGSLATFVENIMGNVQGDLMLDPRLLQSPTNPNAVADNVTLNNSGNGQINNNIALSADSGNATVADNTNGGNATSGTAAAEANIINMISSAIAAHQSFMGVINIYGNLSGNILVPSDLLNSLVATNGTGSTDPTNATTTINNTNDQAINNQIDTAAKSGSAAVADNTNGGNATSGTATTNVDVFNLTGSQVIGNNDLLVFVNVLGKWVGFIMNAPVGTTAAEIGGGITTNTTGNTTVNNANNSQINNNVTLAAQSGNASVNHNTTGGNATSGNASASANILNLENSNFSLSNWFGILFVNVFGSWFGNLESGSNQTSTPSTSPSSSSTNTTALSGIQAVAIFHFTPTSHNASTYMLSPLASESDSSSQDSASSAADSTATTPSSIPSGTLVSYTSPNGKTSAVIHASTPAHQIRFAVLPFAIGVAGVVVLGTEQFRSLGRRRAFRLIGSVMLSRVSKD